MDNLFLMEGVMPVTNQESYSNIKETAHNDSFSSDLCNKILIKELAELWLFDIKDILRPSSYALYQSYTKKYILPYIGNIQAANFDTNIISKLLDGLCIDRGKVHNKDSNRKKGLLSQYTVYLLESIVRAMFHYGAEKKLIPEIQFGKAEFITIQKKEVLPLAELDIQKLLRLAVKQGEDLQLQILLPLYAGLTLSELCGLKWEDINIETGELYIHRNLVRIQNNIFKSHQNNLENTSGLEMSTTMAECELPENMCRKFVMPETLSCFLKTVLSSRKPAKENYVAELDKKAGRKRNISVQEDMPDGRALQYRLKIAGETAGIKGLTFKTLRDTFAIMCLQAGGDVYSLAYILGTGVPAVCNRYGKWMIMDDSFLKGIG